MTEPILTTMLEGLELLRRGKVRDVYRAAKGRLLLVATDRISAFDVVLPTAVPQKGAVLCQISAFWFERLAPIVPTHLVSVRASTTPEPLRDTMRALGGRASLVEEAKVVPIECVVRGYLAGSVEKAYQQTGEIQGVKLPPGIAIGGKLPAPIFTPTTKEEAGHDIPLTFEETEKKVGPELAARLRDLSLKIFDEASRHCATLGLILCDTKFEFGHLASGELALVDEALTPDSSRFFKAKDHVPGRTPIAWDKQVVRDYLNSLKNWDKKPPGPELPAEIVAETSRRYREVFEIIAGRSLDLAIEEAVR
jgi:phosphoribosylaminoimidazole-succinocarboxamide synthase